MFSTIAYVVLCTILVPSFPWIFFLLYGFVYTPLISYITARMEGIAGQLQHAHDECGYGGFGILPFGKGFTPKYLSEDYFKVYGAALKKARELGMTMCIYDEYGFPSGSAGAIHGDGVGRFANKHPEFKQSH